MADPTQEGGKEVSTARSRLSGALNSAADRFGGNEELAALGVFGSPSKRLHSLDSPLGSPTKSPRPARRRRKKETPLTSAFHHTFVMKLFDRSVDLAQFQEGTSLYPVCRAWMINQPSNTNMAPRLRTPTPEPESDEGEGKDEDKEEDEESTAKPPEAKKTATTDDGSNADNKSDKTEDEDSRSVNKGESMTIYKMPAHVPLRKDDEGTPLSVRIPTPPPQRDIDADFLEIARKNSSGNPPAKDTMLSEHMVRWFKVRRRWREAAAKNEDRYKESMDLLKDMFER